MKILESRRRNSIVIIFYILMINTVLYKVFPYKEIITANDIKEDIQTLKSTCIHLKWDNLLSIPVEDSIIYLNEYRESIRTVSRVLEKYKNILSKSIPLYNLVRWLRLITDKIIERFNEIDEYMKRDSSIECKREGLYKYFKMHLYKLENSHNEYKYEKWMCDFIEELFLDKRFLYENYYYSCIKEHLLNKNKLKREELQGVYNECIKRIKNVVGNRQNIIEGVQWEKSPESIENSVGVLFMQNELFSLFNELYVRTFIRMKGYFPVGFSKVLLFYNNVIGNSIIYRNNVCRSHVFTMLSQEVLEPLVEEKYFMYVYNSMPIWETLLGKEVDILIEARTNTFEQVSINTDNWSRMVKSCFIKEELPKILKSIWSGIGKSIGRINTLIDNTEYHGSILEQNHKKAYIKSFICEIERTVQEDIVGIYSPMSVSSVLKILHVMEDIPSEQTQQIEKLVGHRSFADLYKDAYHHPLFLDRSYSNAHEESSTSQSKESTIKYKPLITGSTPYSNNIDLLGVILTYHNILLGNLFTAVCALLYEKWTILFGINTLHIIDSIIENEMKAQYLLVIAYVYNNIINRVMSVERINMCLKQETHNIIKTCKIKHTSALLPHTEITLLNIDKYVNLSRLMSADRIALGYPILQYDSSNMQKLISSLKDKYSAAMDYIDSYCVLMKAQTAVYMQLAPKYIMGIYRPYLFDTKYVPMAYYTDIIDTYLYTDVYKEYNHKDVLKACIKNSNERKDKISDAIPGMSVKEYQKLKNSPQLSSILQYSQECSMLEMLYMGVLYDKVLRRLVYKGIGIFNASIFRHIMPNLIASPVISFFESFFITYSLDPKTKKELGLCEGRISQVLNEIVKGRESILFLQSTKYKSIDMFPAISDLQAFLFLVNRFNIPEQSSVLPEENIVVLKQIERMNNTTPKNTECINSVANDRIYAWKNKHSSKHSRDTDDSVQIQPVCSILSSKDRNTQMKELSTESSTNISEYIYSTIGVAVAVAISGIMIYYFILSKYV
ncbi:hypothetical protein NEPAR04_0345 [Nematocida parisii]|nr:hypothetical protein NEPAR03_0065 [Nematocida parisii]KAI5125514.1 hypothetical protein NEPAR08_0065 [Nematocida parisii]KAI5140604.1 hypothetical protein NEPAR04_0345 [Nematocida parisii]